MIAVIDIGTNTTRLMLAEFNGKTVNPLSKELITTRLGEGVVRNLNLRISAMERTAAAIQQFVNKAKAVRADAILAFSTSALREAPNKNVFTDYIKETCGLDIEIISGKDEATIGYLGAFGLEQQGHGSLIDIGGGSTELSSGHDGLVDYACSAPVGAVRLHDICADGVKRITEADRLRMSRFIEERTFMFYSVKCVSDVLTGVSGTATSLASIDLKMIKYDPKLIEGRILGYETVKELTEMLLKMTLEQKKALKGLMPQRADIIAGGAMIMEHVMRTKGFKWLKVSEKDNLEGFLLWKYAYRRPEN